MSSGCSWTIVELVRAKIGTEFVRASDTEVARALEVSRAAISAYKHDHDVMSPRTLARAQQLLELPDELLVDFSLTLSMDATPEAKAVWAAHRCILEHAKKFNAAAIVAAVLLAANGGSPNHAGAPVPALAAPGEAVAVGRCA